MNKLLIGVLALQGGVTEHVATTTQALKNLKKNGEVILVRTKADLDKIEALIIPGGESTVLQKLCEREEIFEKMKTIPYLFGTCAGAIMLAKNVKNKALGQKTLTLMDIEIDRNGYGAQTDSFEETVQTPLGKIDAIFIRAPRIKNIGKNVKKLATLNNEIIACEESISNRYYLATCFHPELTTTKFHEYFIKKIILKK